MKRFLIICTTYWCGTDATYSAYAESINDPGLSRAVEEAAYDNFSQYFNVEDILQTEGYDPDNMSEKDMDSALDWIDESLYYDTSIEEFDGDDEEFNSYEIIYDVRKQILP